MGTNNLPQATDGTPIPASDHNALKTAMEGVLVPRNSSGIPTDLAGGAGNTTYRFGPSYFLSLFIGAIASLISLEDNAGALEIKIGGVLKCKIDSTGILGSFLKDLSVTASKIENGIIAPQITLLTSSGTFTVPAGVTRIFKEVCGGSGGGGGGGGANTTGGGGVGSGGGGGGGGAPGMPRVFALDVTPGDIFTCTIGNGGTGGPGGNGLVAGTNGNNGDRTLVQRTTAFAGTKPRNFFHSPGGAGGIGGAAGADSSPGTGGQSGTNPEFTDPTNNVFRLNGGTPSATPSVRDGQDGIGTGGSGGAGGLAGNYIGGDGGLGSENTSNGSGGAGDANNGGGGGGGGGASSSSGKGGDGGDEQQVGASVIGSGGGGGGGGGGLTVGGNAAASAGSAGGNGGRGYVRFFYWSKE